MDSTEITGTDVTCNPHNWLSECIIPTFALTKTRAITMEDIGYMNQSYTSMDKQNHKELKYPEKGLGGYHLVKSVSVDSVGFAFCKKEEAQCYQNHHSDGMESISGKYLYAYHVRPNSSPNLSALIIKTKEVKRAQKKKAITSPTRSSDNDLFSVKLKEKKNFCTEEAGQSLNSMKTEKVLCKPLLQKFLPSPRLVALLDTSRPSSVSSISSGSVATEERVEASRLLYNERNTNGSCLLPSFSSSSLHCRSHSTTMQSSNSSCSSDEQVDYLLMEDSDDFSVEGDNVEEDEIGKEENSQYSLAPDNKEDEIHNICHTFPLLQSESSPLPSLPHCPTRPFTLVRTHFTIQLHDTACLRDLIHSIHICLESFAEYDFSSFKQGVVWKGKYIRSSQCCLIYINLYHEVDCKNCYIAEVVKVYGDSKPFWEFFREFRCMMIHSALLSSVEQSSSSCRLPILSSSHHCLVPSNSTSSIGSCGATTIATVSTTSLPPLFTVVEELPGSPSPYAYASDCPQFFSSSFIGSRSRQNSDASKTSTIWSGGLGGSWNGNNGRVEAGGIALGGAAGDVGGVTGGCKESFHSKVILNKEEFLHNIRPILLMEQSPYYEVKLEAAKMLCDLCTHEQYQQYYFLIGQHHDDCMRLIIQILERLILTSGFMRVREQAIIAFACYSEIPGYAEIMLDSTVMTVIMSLIDNPGNEKKAYESIQVRRECARIVEAIAKYDIKRFVTHMNNIYYPLINWLEKIDKIVDLRTRLTALRVKGMILLKCPSSTSYAKK